MRMREGVERGSGGRREGRWAVLIVCTVALMSPLPAAAASHGISDPFEPMNRAFFALHQVVDHFIIRPAAVAYRRILPKPIRHGVANLISNLGEPSVFVNDVLQGHGKAATKTFTRFAGNTTFGLLGVIDIATPAGLPHHPNDFGITLARYGVGPGPYLFVPLAGPTTVRDAVGSAAGLALNPLIFFRYTGDETVGATKILGGGLQARSDADGDLKALFASATDPYASLRSFFLQNREAEISGGRIDIETLPDFGAQDASPSPATALPPPAPEATPPAPSAAAPTSADLAAPPAATPSGAAMSAELDVAGDAPDSAGQP